MDFPITGRIALNGEKLSGEIRKITSSFGPEFARAGGEAARQFEDKLDPGLRSAERKIRDTLKRAFAATPNDAGVLDLDLPGLRASAAAMEVKTQRARQLAAAIEAVNASTQNVTRSQQAELAAAQATATKYEQQTRALNAEVAALERLQAELGQTAVAQVRAGEASNSHRYALQNAGHQVQDFFVQVAGGTSVLRAFTLQAPQFIGAIANMGDEGNRSNGKLGALMRLIGGPFGIALGIAIPVLGIMADKLFDMGEEADKAAPKVNRLTNAYRRLQVERGKAAAGDIAAARVEIATGEARLKDLDGQIAEAQKRLNAATGSRVATGLAGGAQYSVFGRDLDRLKAERKALLFGDGSEEDPGLVRLKRLTAEQERRRKDVTEFEKIQDEKEEARRKAESEARKAETAGRTAAKREQREQAREAERAKDAQEHLNKALADGIQTLRDSNSLSRVRREEGAAAAAIAEAEVRIARDFPELEKAKVGAVIEYRGAQITITEELLKQLELLRALSKEEAVRKAAAGSAAKGAGKVGAFIQGRTGDLAKGEVAEERQRLESLARDFENLFGNGTGAIWAKFEQEGVSTLAKLAAEKFPDLLSKIETKLGVSSGALSRITGNAALGRATGGGTAGAISGAVGGELGEKFLTKGLDKIFKGLGDFAGPIGAIAGGLLTGLTSLFKKAPSATAVVTSTTAPAQVTGNNAGAKEAVSGISVDLQSSLTRIIEALGGTAGTFAVSIGKYKDDYRVKSDGSATAGNKHPGDANLIYNGPDAQEAMRIAILDAIGDGAVQGISDSLRRLISNNQDIDVGLSKALRLQSALKDFKEMTDPMGAALDEVNLKFRQLIDIAKEAGATDTELSQLEAVYKREREAAIKAVAGQADSLKSFLQGLKAGSGSQLSLREQRANAEAALEPFRRDIAAGKAVDTSALQTAISTALNVERQISGSTRAYFDQENLLVSLAEKAIAQIDAQAASGANAEDPFQKAIAASSQASANILEQQTQILAEQNDYLAAIAQATGATRNTTSFVGAPRAYVQAR